MRNNEDVKEFYLGIAKDGASSAGSFRNVKSYRRRKRWIA